MGFLTCPECNNTMGKINAGGIELDSCDNCSGLFFDFKEIKDVLDRISYDDLINSDIKEILHGDFTFDHQGNIYKCPSCSFDMDEREYIYGSGIHMDFCPNCFGIYLNSAEIDEIRKFKYSSENSKEGKDLISGLENRLSKISQEQEKKLKQIEYNPNNGLIGKIYDLIDFFQIIKKKD